MLVPVGATAVDLARWQLKFATVGGTDVLDGLLDIVPGASQNLLSTSDDRPPALSGKIETVGGPGVGSDPEDLQAPACLEQLIAAGVPVKSGGRTAGRPGCESGDDRRILSGADVGRVFVVMSARI